MKRAADPTDNLAHDEAVCGVRRWLEEYTDREPADEMKKRWYYIIRDVLLPALNQYAGKDEPSVGLDDFTCIEHINKSVLQLRGVFGVISSMGGNSPQEVALSPEDMTNLSWLVDDLLAEIDAAADQLHKDLLRAQASRSAGKSRTQPSAAAAQPGGEL